MNDFTRKLATIFAADVAGYSRLVSEDEDSAIRQLHLLREQMDRIIGEYGGRIANTAGDSVIAEFASAVDAVRAAVAIQQVHKEHNASVPVDRRLEYRVGINIGDILVQPNGDILGDGVNVAARLESIANPGGICLSQSVYDHVHGKLQFSLTKSGEHFVKNISRPIRVYRVGGDNQTLRGNLLRQLRHAHRRPTVQFAAVVSILLALGISLWASYSSSRNLVVVDASLANLLANADNDAILAHFPIRASGRFNGSDYHIIHAPNLRFDDVTALAEALGGHLAAIGSDEENEFIFNLSRERPEFWTLEYTDAGPQWDGPMFGLVRTQMTPNASEGWEWTNGEPIGYLNWDKWSPDFSRPEQVCAQYRSNGSQPHDRWDDIGCGRRNFVIEVPSRKSLRSSR